MTLKPSVKQPARSTGLWIAFAIIGMHLIAAIGLNYPGHLSVDSIVQLSEARRGIYESFHPPFTTWLLGIADSIVSGTGLYIILNATIHAVSLAWLVRLMPRITWLGLCALALWAVWPITLIYDGIVWKDVLFANMAMLGASASFAYTKNKNAINLIYVVIIAALLMLIRQHGLLISVLLCISVCVVITPKSGSSASLKRTIAFSALLIAAALLFSQLILFLIAISLSSPPSRGTSTGLILLMVYDIAGILANAPGLTTADFRLFADAKVDMPKLLLELRGTYAASRIDSLTPNALWSIVPSNSNIFPLVAKQWWHLVLSEPWAYISHRSNVFSWALGFRDQLQCLPIHLGTIKEPKALFAALALTQGESAFGHRLYLYARPGINTPMFAPASYCAVIAFIMLSLMRQWREHAVALGFGTGCLLFCAAYAVVGLACDFRYMYVAVPAAFWLLIYRVSLKPG